MASAKMGKLAPTKPQISKVAKIPVNTTKDIYENLLHCTDGISVDWAGNGGALADIPLIDFNVRTARIFKEGEGTCLSYAPLLGLATALFLIPKDNFLHMCAIVASGDNATGVIGFGADDAIKAGPYWQGALANVKVSGAAGGGAYPTFAEVGIQMNKYYNGSGVASLLAAYADQAGAGADEKAHVTLVYIMRSLFTRMSEKAAVQYLASLRGALLKAAVEACEYDVDEDTFILDCTQNFAKFFKRHKQKIEVFTPWLLAEVVTAWADQVDDEGKFVEVGEFKLQHVDPESLYSRTKSWTGTRKVRIRNVDESLDEVVVDDGSTDLTPSDDDISDKPDVTIIYDEGDNAMIWDPPAVKTKADGCALLENNGSPIGVAAEIGLAQQSKGKYLDLFTSYPDWSEKQRRKKLKMQEVVPDLPDELAKMQCAVWIPNAETKGHEEALGEAANTIFTKWWDDYGAQLEAAIADDPHAYTHTANGVEYIIDRRKWDAGVVPTLETILHEDPEIEDKWMRGLPIGRELWVNLCALRPITELLCIPLVDLSEGHKALITRESVSSLECTRLTTSELSGYYNIRAVADLFSTEHEHCVTEYKKRAEAYMIFSALMGDAKGNWYWLLLLLIIPITVLAVAIASANHDRDQQRR